MHFKLSVSLAALVILPSGNAPMRAEALDVLGEWRGAVVRDNREWSVRFASWTTPTGVRVCFDFPDYGLYYRCTSDVVADDGDVRIRYVTGRDTVTLEGRVVSAIFAGRWTGLGVQADFRFTQTESAAAPLIEENVAFRNGDVQLSGTLIRPGSTRRYPAVVWTHGSGNQRRTEDFYRDRGYLLAEHGVASLIYDKRGVGESTGDPEATLDELAGDAVAAVQFLQARADIDRDAVGIGGFSQGGYVAPLAAARYGRIAFLVTGATPGVTPAEANDFAAQTALTRRGLPADVIQRAMNLRRDVLRAQETGNDFAGVERLLVEARGEAWFRFADLPTTPLRQYGRRALSVLRFDPGPVWERIEVPVFAVWGENDALVPVERSKQLVETSLRAARNDAVVTRVFPGASHGLAATARAGVWDWPRLADGFHDSMVDWIVARGSRR